MLAPGISQNLPDPLFELPLRIEAGDSEFLVIDAAGQIIAVTVGISGFALERIEAIVGLCNGTPTDKVGPNTAPDAWHPLARGELVVWLNDPRRKSTRNLYVVIGSTESTEDGEPRIRIQAIQRDLNSQSMAYTVAPFQAEIASLVPISRFGMHVDQVAAITGSNGRRWTTLTLASYPDPPPGAAEWRGTLRDLSDRIARIDDPLLAELIRSAMLSKRPAEPARAAS